MAETILLLFLISGLMIFLLYIFIKGTSLSRRTILLIMTFGLIAIVSLSLYTGVDKIKADIVRVVHNSRPKEATKVYTLLFRKPLDSCVTFINFKDQIIPGIDCCIWMEIKTCQKELNRVITGKKYQKTSGSGQCDSQRIAEIKKAINNNAIPEALDNFWTGKLKYGLSGSLVMFLDKKYGRTKLKELLPLNKKSSLLLNLNTTESELLNDWKYYIQNL